MLFTVVIPLYNKSYSIKRCIDSILCQEYQEFEIIVVNDGSTDESVNILNGLYSEQLSVGKIRLLEQENMGVSAARNAGVKAALYDYICFLDADDEWDKKYLSTIFKLVNDFPYASLYSVAHQVSRRNGRFLEKRFSRLPKEFRGYVDDFFYQSISNDLVNSSTACVKKSAFSAIGGFPIDVISGEDYFVWIMLALHGDVAFENKCLVTLHSEKDPSRNLRKNTVPYPLIYFSSSKSVEISKPLKRYLFVIFYKHFIMSLFKFRLREAYFRLSYYIKILRK